MNRRGWTWTSRAVAATVVGTAAIVVGTGAMAHAHVGVSGSSTEAGSYTILTFSVPHGCDGASTTTVAVQIPQELTTATPTRLAGWDVEKVMETLDEPVQDSHGNELTERVDQIVYTAQTPLPDDIRAAFEVSVRLPDDAAGQTLYFPTVQTCEQGETAWIDVPAEGQDPHSLAAPAPALKVTEAAADDHGPEAADDASRTSAESTDDTVEAASVGTDDDGDLDLGLVLSIIALVLAGVAMLLGAVAVRRGRTAA